MTYYLPTGIMNSKIWSILMQSVESCIPSICCARHTPDMSTVFTRCAATMCLEIILNPAPCQAVAGEDLWNCADGRARRAAVTLEKLGVQLCHSSARCAWPWGWGRGSKGSSQRRAWHTGARAVAAGGSAAQLEEGYQQETLEQIRRRCGDGGAEA